MQIKEEVQIYRFKNNPLISPDPQIPWMTETAFNPGVVKDDNGLFHMLIRGGSVRGTPKFSNIGYAKSYDGIHWNIAKEPVLKYLNYGYEAEEGIEDPRIVKWDENYYIFLTICGRHYGRLALFKTTDFSRFFYMGTIFDWDDKNASIVPQVINDRMYLIHRIAPNIWISETTHTLSLTGWTNSRVLMYSYRITLDGRVPRKIGLAAPLQQLDNGDWLMLFHAVFEPFEYRIGFMILTSDLQVKYVHPKSILRPELPCEKYGVVPHVCFLTGIVDVGDRWFVYWGGADTVVCGGYLLKEAITSAWEEHV